MRWLAAAARHPLPLRTTWFRVRGCLVFLSEHDHPTCLLLCRSSEPDTACGILDCSVRRTSADAVLQEHFSPRASSCWCSSSRCPGCNAALTTQRSHRDNGFRLVAARHLSTAGTNPRGTTLSLHKRANPSSPPDVPARSPCASMRPKATSRRTAQPYHVPRGKSRARRFLLLHSAQAAESWHTAVFFSPDAATKLLETAHWTPHGVFVVTYPQFSWFFCVDERGQVEYNWGEGGNSG